jgi:hypothetical protein
MKTAISIALSTLLLAACLTTVGCSTSQIVTDLDIASGAIDAVEVALPLAGALVPAPVEAIIENYCQQADTNIVSTVAELNSTDVAAQKAVVISGIWGTTAVLDIPEVPGTVANAITAAVSAITKIIGDVSSGNMALKANAKTADKFSLSWWQRHKLNSARATAEKTLAKIAARRAARK